MKIGVIGAGTMGQGIAKAFAQVEGNTVALCDLLLGVALAMYRRVDVEQKDSGVTVEEEIDGWRDGEGGGAVKDAKRLDYIFCNTQKKSKVIESGM